MRFVNGIKSSVKPRAKLLLPVLFRSGEGTGKDTILPAQETIYAFILGRLLSVRIHLSVSLCPPALKLAIPPGFPPNQRTTLLPYSRLGRSLCARSPTPILHLTSVILRIFVLSWIPPLYFLLVPLKPSLNQSTL